MKFIFDTTDSRGISKWGGYRLDTNRLNTSHSQRLNSDKSLGTGRCGWWCPIDPCPDEPLLFKCSFMQYCKQSILSKTSEITAQIEYIPA